MMTETEIRARKSYLESLLKKADTPNGRVLEIQINELEIVLDERGPKISA